MNNKIVKDLKKYIVLNLEDRIHQIMSNNHKVILLSKRDLISIISFMKKKKIYSRSILEYIYTKCIHIYYPEKSLPDLNNFILMDAAKRGNIDVIKFLLSFEVMTLYPKAHIDPSANNNHAIKLAIMFGHLDIVKFLFSREIRILYPKAQIDPCIDDNYAIRVACEYGRIEIAKYLLSDEILTLFPNINLSALNNSAIRYASFYKCIDIVEFIRINVYNYTPLFDILRNTAKH